MMEGEVSSDERLATDLRDDNLTVRDLINYLSSLAKLHRDKKTGNLDLSNGIIELAGALRPYANRPVADLTSIIGKKGSLSEYRKPAKNAKANLPHELKSISYDKVINILENRDFEKNQLIELGVVRFSIPQSKLARLNRSQVLETIRASMDNERALDAIVQEARNAGISRSS